MKIPVRIRLTIAFICLFVIIGYAFIMITATEQSEEILENLLNIMAQGLANYR